MKTNEIKMIKKNKGTSLEFIANDGKISFVPVIDNEKTKFFLNPIHIEGNIPDGRYYVNDSIDLTKNAEMIDWNSIGYETVEEETERDYFVKNYFVINGKKFEFKELSYFMDIPEEEKFSFSRYDKVVKFTKDNCKLLNKLLKCCSVDRCRMFMNGIFFDKENYIVSTDGKWMLFTEFEVSDVIKEFEHDFILNRSIVPYMKDDCEIWFMKKESNNNYSDWAILSTEEGNYAFKMINDSQFPKWRRVVPENASVLSGRIIPEFKPCELDFKELKTLKGHRVFFTSEKTELESENSNMRFPLKSRLPIKESETVCFDPNILKNFPSVFDNSISIWLNDEMKAHVFVESPNVYDYDLKNKIRAVVMPMVNH